MLDVVFPQTWKHNSSVNSITAAQIDRIRPSHMTDVGCGDGFYGIITYQLSPGVDITGLDVNPKWVAHCRKLFSYDRVLQVDLSDYDFEPSDLVIFGDVLEHVEKHVAMDALSRCLRVAKWVIVNGPVGFQPQDHEEPAEIHRCGIERDDFNGFNVIEYQETEPGKMMNCLLRGAP